MFKVPQFANFQIAFPLRNRVQNGIAVDRGCYTEHGQLLVSGIQVLGCVRGFNIFFNDFHCSIAVQI